MRSEPRIDLDANATTPCDPRVVAAMLPWWTERAGNASSPHREGQLARQAVEDARDEVAALLGCLASEVVFTSGGTEADNLGLAGLARSARRTDPTRVRLLVSAVEHPAISECAKSLAAEGFEPVAIPVDRRGVVGLDWLRENLGPTTAAVAVMVANNETGTIQPWREAAAIARNAGARFHADAVQGAGKIELDFGSSSADTLAVSAHKFHGPKGVGALAVRQGVDLAPILAGGLQERRRRPGTEPVPLIVGLGVAAKIALTERGANLAAIAELRDRLETALLGAIPGANVNGRSAPRTANTISLTIPGVSAETLLIRLDLEGVATSTGAACSTGVVRPSPTLRAMGLSAVEAASTLRLSLSKNTTHAEIETVVELLPRLARAVRDAGVRG